MKNLDVLESIESGIMKVYRAHSSLLDVDAKDAIDALIRYYHAEEEQHTPPVRRLGERAERVFLSVKSLCEYRLGRESEAAEGAVEAAPVPVADLVRALRKIQKSIPFWTERGGRKGYLDFVKDYVK